MGKFFTRILLAANILACCSNAFAGFGERKWDFAPNESVTIGSSDIVHQGVEYSCNEFIPQKTSFTLSYSSLSDLNKLRIVADDEGKIIHDKENKVFTLKGMKSLAVSFPSEGIYIFKNIIEKRIIGIDCDTGDY
ncbi:hypothetical protein MCO_00030 [Bartonella sp. DB5-6]|uniref:hypothetical protein n=1 Tax=Bartonella sp. DB5-6 TaxID=1094755 RepID=UPI00026E893D|nr:hypothetical protein [Bartonella sp. DB5-6]EJF80798.1 hypothetical protein MCO_00030 [Bartonella sp. DB5-6]